MNGLENLVDDLEKNDGEFNVSLTDETAFEIGKNIANAEGSVIYENKLYQLIYYKPTQEISHQIPILIITFINDSNISYWRCWFHRKSY